MILLVLDTLQNLFYVFSLCCCCFILVFIFAPWLPWTLVWLNEIQTRLKSKQCLAAAIPQIGSGEPLSLAGSSLCACQQTCRRAILHALLEASSPSFPSFRRYWVGDHSTDYFSVMLPLMVAARWVDIDTSFSPDNHFLAPSFSRYQFPNSSV